MKYSVIRPPSDIKELIEVAVRVACGELSCCLPDEVFCVAADPNGRLETRSNVGGWFDDRGVFVVTSGRQPHAIVRTILHECSHFADSLTYFDFRAAVKDHEESEQRAQTFANRHLQGLPEGSPNQLLKALRERLHGQRYPLAHLEAWFTSQRALGLKPSPPSWVEQYGRSRWELVAMRGRNLHLINNR